MSATPLATSPQARTALVWLRRDLRLHDHAALHAALQSAQQVVLVFVFDTGILNPLPRCDRRVEFIRESLVEIDAALRAMAPHAGLICRYGDPLVEIPALAQKMGAAMVVAAHDDEPQALARDAAVAQTLKVAGVHWHSVKDQVVFERREVLTQTGKPYGVFSPYLRAWLARLESADSADVAERSTAGLARKLAAIDATLACGVPSLPSMGFETSNLRQLGITPGSSGAQALLEDFLPRMGAYEERRNFPSVKGPSYMGVHLRFGTVSIRELVRVALPAQRSGDPGARVWLAELVWREFYVQILANFPHVATHAFKPEYDTIQWDGDDLAQQRFTAWCAGRTGYPLVDAAMLQLNQSGYMHNRLRMVAGSFLVKHLGLDWRWGERYFAQQLNDFDLASNNGGWQWVASSGCDAQPYFRIFNPISQSEKFDTQGAFIRRYLPALAQLNAKSIHAPWLTRPLELAAAGVRLGDGPDANYPLPIVDHAQARAKTLLRYSVVKKPGLGSETAAD
jgi:deoxyribodipyrimidine photo-lyase